MKKWLYLIAAAAAVGILSRLPHPAQDIAKLDPVRTIYLYMEEGLLHIRTDTGDHGSGPDLTAADQNMRENADSEIYLGTAEYLILSLDVPVTPDFYTLLHPDCRVCFTNHTPDLQTAAQYLSIHTPELTLAHLRAEIEANR